MINKDKMNIRNFVQPIALARAAMLLSFEMTASKKKPSEPKKEARFLVIKHLQVI